MSRLNAAPTLQDLIESDTPTDRSLDQQFTKLPSSNANWKAVMASDDYTKFKNDRGVPEIRIGVKKFKCTGVSAPQDHPHIYLDMGAADTILCPYCATLFRFDPRLGPREANPPDSVFLD